MQRLRPIFAEYNSLSTVMTLQYLSQAGNELYEQVAQIGVGSTGVSRLMRDRRTNELVAAKWVPHTAGEMLSVQVEREILNHRRLLHNNVVRFREVTNP